MLTNGSSIATNSLLYCTTAHVRVIWVNKLLIYCFLWKHRVCEPQKEAKRKNFQSLRSRCTAAIFPQSRTALLTERAIKPNKNYHKLVCATQLRRFITEAQFTPSTVKHPKTTTKLFRFKSSHVNDSCFGHVGELRHDLIDSCMTLLIVTIAVALWKFLNPTFSRYLVYDWPLNPIHKENDCDAKKAGKSATMRCVRPHDDGNIATTSARRDNV